VPDRRGAGRFVAPVLAIGHESLPWDSWCAADFASSRAAWIVQSRESRVFSGGMGRGGIEPPTLGLKVGVGGFEGVRV